MDQVRDYRFCITVVLTSAVFCCISIACIITHKIQSPSPGITFTLSMPEPRNHACSSAAFALKHDFYRHFINWICNSFIFRPLRAGVVGYQTHSQWAINLNQVIRRYMRTRHSFALDLLHRLSVIPLDPPTKFTEPAASGYIVYSESTY